MRQATHSEREKFVALVIRHCPTATASTCQRLMRLGATFGRLARSHDRTLMQAIKMQFIGRKIISQAQALQMEVWFPTPAEHSASVGLIRGDGDVIIPIPTS